MQAKFLKAIVEDLVNKEAVPIINLLAGKKHVNEFLIAKKLRLTINQTRNILYKLSDYGLVSFIRKKDKRKGWYIYFWTLNIYQSLSLLELNLKNKIEQLEYKLRSKKEKRHYICNTCSIEVTEEAALLNDFVCPECEEVYELADSQEIIKNLEKEIAKIKREINFVSSERKKEEAKLEKKKVRKIQRAEKKRKTKRIGRKKMKKLEEKKKTKEAPEKTRKKTKKSYKKVSKSKKKE